MSTIPQTIDSNGFKIVSADQTQQMTMTMTDPTTKGFILDYDLTTTAKNFSITYNGVKWTSGATTYTTALDRLAVVQQAFQAVQLPANSTTLKVNKTVLLDDNTNNGSFNLNGSNTEITASSNLSLNPTGLITTNGKVLDASGGLIQNCQNISGQTNVNFAVEAKGSGGLLLRTNNTNRVAINNAGTTTFAILPECGAVPTTANQLVNKTYVDGAVTTPSLSSVLLTGNSAGSTSINMNNQSIQNCQTINGQTNTDFIIEGKGTGGIILKTDSTNRATVDSSGNISFVSLPTCSVVPTTANQLVNKAYVDGAGGTPSLSSVLLTGNSAGSSNINMNNQSIQNVSNITYSNMALTGTNLTLDASSVNINYLGPTTSYDNLIIKNNKLYEVSNYWLMGVKNTQAAFLANTDNIITLDVSSTTISGYGITTDASGARIFFNSTGVFRIGTRITTTQSTGAFLNVFYWLVDPSGAVSNSFNNFGVGSNQRTSSYFDFFYNCTNSANWIELHGASSGAFTISRDTATIAGVSIACPPVRMVVTRVE